MDTNDIELANAALSTYDQNFASTINSDWNYWSLRIRIFDRQLSSAIINCSNESSCEQNVTEARNLLFNLDQCLHRIMKNSSFPGIEADITNDLNTFIAKLIMHFVSVLYAKENASADWKNILEPTVPLLFFVYTFGPTLDSDGNFQVFQAANTLLSCVGNGESLWANEHEILTDAHNIVKVPEWREHIFFNAFVAKEHRSCTSTSFLLNTRILDGDHFLKWPRKTDVLLYGLKAQAVKPDSLAHLVYLALCSENYAALTDFKLVIFRMLNFSPCDLSNCNIETISQLDVEAFLYATVIDAKRRNNVEKKGLMLPFVNLASHLFTDEQSYWWSNVAKVNIN